MALEPPREEEYGGRTSPLPSEIVGRGEEDEEPVLLRVGAGGGREGEVSRDHVRPLPPPTGEAYVGSHVLGPEATREAQAVVVHVRGVVDVGPRRVAGGEVGEEARPERESPSQGELTAERDVQHRMSNHLVVEGLGL